MRRNRDTLHYGMDRTWPASGRKSLNCLTLTRWRDTERYVTLSRHRWIGGRCENGLWVVRKAYLRITKHAFGRPALKDDSATFAVHRKNDGLSDRLPPMKVGLILCFINDRLCDGVGEKA